MYITVDIHNTVQIFQDFQDFRGNSNFVICPLNISKP